MTRKTPQPKPFPRRCFKCSDRSVERLIEKRTMKARYDGSTYEFPVDLPVNRCTNCEASSLDNDADEAIGRELRHHLGLLQPEDIHRNRRALGLTQQELADRIGCAGESVSRWEAGLVVQSRLYDGMLRAYFAVPELRRFFEALRSGQDVGRSIVTDTGSYAIESWMDAGDSSGMSRTSSGDSWAAEAEAGGPFKIPDDPDGRPGAGVKVG